MWKAGLSKTCCLLSLTFLCKYIPVRSRVTLEIVQNGTDLPAESPQGNYSALVVFGDSYSDDGHPRPPKYQPSLSSSPAFGGRCCDGPVWDEFLAQELSTSSSLAYRNYAYNGAHISNKLSNLSSTPVPDTEAQIQTYLNALQEGSQSSQEIVDGRILHTLWIGINPLIAMWTSKSDVNITIHANTLLTPKIVQKIDRQILELSKQVVKLLENSSLSKVQSDFMLLTIPPLKITKLAQDKAFAMSEGKDNLKKHYLTLLSQMTDHFNMRLKEAVDELKQKIQKSTRQDRILVFDTNEVWKEVQAAPWRFEINSLGACYPDSTKPPCSQPDHCMYWDALHPSSHLHSQLSVSILKYLQARDENA